MTLTALVAVALTWVMWARTPGPSPVSGTVTCNGQPVGNGQIIFLPPNPAGQQATSKIIGGKFSLTSFAPNDGAMPGTYSVDIVPPSVPAKYGSQSTSGLTVRINKTANFVSFDLR